MPEGAPISRLLRAWSEGDEAALERLVPLIESDLRRLAQGYMARERRDHTLQTSALVNQAFLRLVDARDVRWQDRAHFLAIAARLMRRVLVDHARTRGFKKRGAEWGKVPLDEAVLVSRSPDVDILDLDWALDALAHMDETQSARRRVALLCRDDGRRNCRGAAGLHRHGEAGLACGEAVAAARASG